MPYKQIWLFVEGETDKQFFDNVIKPILERRYNKVMITEYAQMLDSIVCNLMKGLKSQKAENIFITDINNTPCITTKKDKTIERYKTLDKEQIIIVVREIESWILAGLDKKKANELGLKYKRITDKVTKDSFETDAIECQGYKRLRGSMMAYKIELINNFSIEQALTRNKSFKYFHDKYLV